MYTHLVSFLPFHLFSFFFSQIFVHKHNFSFFSLKIYVYKPEEQNRMLTSHFGPKTYPKS